MNTNTIIIFFLILIWFLFWWLYNFVFMKRGITTEKGSTKSSPIFLSCALLILFVSGVYKEIDIDIYILVCLVILLLSLLTRHREFGRLSNSVFQMTWFFTLSYFVSDNFLLLGMIFFVTHILILVVKHIGIKPKLLILGGSLVGGILIGYILLEVEYPFNLVLAIFSHYIFYVFLRPLDKRFKMNMLH